METGIHSHAGAWERDEIRNNMMSLEIKKLSEKTSAPISTAEALYLVFRALPKKDRVAVARYILEDEDIRYNSGLFENPNETTQKAFAEDKLSMPEFHSVEELRKDLLS